MTYFIKILTGTMTFESEGLLIVAIYIWLPPASYVVFSDNSGLYSPFKIMKSVHIDYVLYKLVLYIHFISTISICFITLFVL